MFLDTDNAYIIRNLKKSNESSFYLAFKNV